MDEILLVPNSTNPLSQRDYSPDKFSIMNESRNGNYKQTLQKQASKKYSIDTSIKASNKFVKKSSLRMPPLCNNSSSLNMSSMNNYQNPIFLPNLQSSINSNINYSNTNTNSNTTHNNTMGLASQLYNNPVNVSSHTGMLSHQSTNVNTNVALSSQNNNNAHNTSATNANGNGINLALSLHSQSELSPQAYTNKYQEHMVRKIANSSSFMSHNYTSSPTSRIHKEASKQSLGTIYSSGNTAQNHYHQQQSTRQSQFRSSRLYKKFYNPNGINSNPPTHHLINQELQQSLGTLNGGNSNHSLDKSPYQRQLAQGYQQAEHNITSGQTSVSKQRNTTHNTLSHNQQPTNIFSSQHQSNIINQARKGMSLYQKRKMKINQVSLGNISITDERSTDIHEESSFNNQSLTNNLHQETNGRGFSNGNNNITPYKTVNNFNNLKSVTKSTSSKQSSQLRHQHPSNHNTNNNMPEPQHSALTDHLRSYQRKNKFTSHKEGCQSQNANELLSERELGNQPSIQIMTEQCSNANAQTLLLKIEEENNDFKSRSKNGQSQQYLKQLAQDNISKASSKTELPELRQSKFQVQQSANINLIPNSYNRLQNNQSINLNRLSQQQRQQQAFISSETSSRTQLNQFGSSMHHDTMSYMDKLQLSGKKNTSKISHLRVNPDSINNQSITSHQLTEIETSVSPRYLIDNGSKQGHKLMPSQKKQSSQSLSLKTQTSFNQSVNKIRIEINKEESVLQFLTKDHKQGQSLLYYDFNGSNQRMNNNKQQRVQQNLADLIIPEETEELPMINITNKDQLQRQDSAQILARLAKNQIASANIYGNQNTLPTQQSITQQSVSPRQEVEIVNQKIDKARKKISRYFAQNQSLSNLSMNNTTATNQSAMNREQNSLKNLSVDIVRMGSPFFGNSIQKNMQNSPKLVNTKQSSSTMKISPPKQQQIIIQSHQQTFQEKNKSQFFSLEQKLVKKETSQFYVNTQTQNGEHSNTSRMGNIKEDEYSNSDDDRYVNEEYPNDFSFNQDEVSQYGENKQANKGQDGIVHQPEIVIEEQQQDDISVQNLDEVQVMIYNNQYSDVKLGLDNGSDSNHLKIRDDSYSQDSFLEEGHGVFSSTQVKKQSAKTNSKHYKQTLPSISNNLKKQIKNADFNQFDRSRLKQVKRTSTVDYVKEEESVWS